MAFPDQKVRNFTVRPLISMSIDTARMNQVFQYLKIKNHSWEEISELYENWADHYKHDRHRNLSIQDIQAISAVYEWKSNNIYKQRAQFTDFLAKNKEFYHDDLDVVINRMIAKRTEFVQRSIDVHNLRIARQIFINGLEKLSSIDLVPHRRK